MLRFFFFYREKIDGDLTTLHKSKKLVMIDFDGTIADSFDVVIEVVKEVSSDYHLPPLNDERVQEIREKGIKKLFQELDLSFIRKIFLIVKLKKIILAEMNQVAPFIGVKEEIKALLDLGHALVIVTSNSKENVDCFLEDHQMGDLFSVICSDVGIFSKKRMITKMIKGGQFDKVDCLYIGDEVRDIESARDSGIKSAAVGWGYQTKEALMSMRPNLFIDEVHDLSREVTKEFEKS